MATAASWFFACTTSTKESSAQTAPEPSIVASNATANLSVAVTGTPAPTYQWFFNGSPTGINSSALSIPNFQAANQGAYHVIVSNSLGAVTSVDAVLMLAGPMRMGSFSLTNGACQFQLIGSSGSNYVIQVSTNLTDWVAIATNTATNGYWTFTDTNSASLPNRFYRAVGN